jgi:hypothetical protein
MGEVGRPALGMRTPGAVPWREKQREYNRDYFRLVRACVLDPHQFVRQTHCSACRRAYNRLYMRKARGSKVWLKEPD